MTMTPEKHDPSSHRGIENKVLEYKGMLTSDVRIHLLDLLKCIALCNLGPRNDIKKFVGIALELLDNAQRYNSSHAVDFRWHIDEDQLVVTISNKASKDDAMRLVESVNAVEQMSPEEIAQAFKEQMMTSDFGKKGGAGLGILQIARKVGNNIRAEIRPLPADEYLCTSTVTTNLGGERPTT